MDLLRDLPEELRAQIWACYRSDLRLRTPVPCEALHRRYLAHAARHGLPPSVLVLPSLLRDVGARHGAVWRFFAPAPAWVWGE